MKSLLTKLAILVVATITITYLSSALARSVAGDESVPAFTIQMVETGAYHGTLVVKHRTEAYKADGSMAKLVENDFGLASGPVFTKTIRDVSERKLTIFEPATMVRTTFRLNNKDIDIAQHTRSSCSDGVREEFLSFEVFHTTQILTEMNNLKVELWRAPVLNCTIVKLVASQQLPSGEYEVEVQHEATSIVMGEPDARLFQEPIGYNKELGPIDAFKAIKEKQGRPNDSYGMAEIKAQERYDAANR